MVDKATIDTLIWVIPLVIVIVFVLIDIFLYVRYSSQTIIPAVGSLAAAYVSSDPSTKTQTWTVSWVGLVPGATYSYYLSETSTFPGELRVGAIPIGVTGSTTGNVATFNNLPSSSTFSFSVTGSFGGASSSPADVEWCSLVEDGDLVYIATQFQGLVVASPDTPQEVYSSPQAPPYIPSSLFYASAIPNQTQTFAFNTSAGGYLYVDPSSGALIMSDTTSPQDTNAQFAIEATDGGVNLRSISTGLYVSFTGPQDPEDRPTGIANSQIADTFTLASTLYFGNGRVTSMNFPNPPANGVFLQVFPQFTFPEGILAIVDNPSPPITDGSFFFNPAYDVSSATWRFVWNGSLNMGITGSSEDIANCGGNNPTVLFRNIGNRDDLATWKVVPQTANTFNLLNTSSNSYATFCEQCCSPQGERVNTANVVGTYPQPFTEMRSFTNLGG